MKFYKKRWIQSGIILISSLGIVLSVFPSFADDNIDNLKGQTSALESELDGINKDILSLSEEISATEMQVEILNGEIARTSDALVEAEENENEQYENMKSRIKYMYEHGNATLLEMLFSAENMADFINKADFIENLSEYDKTALDDLKNIYKNIEDQKNTLETQQDSLLDLKDELKKKQTELQEKAKATSTNLTEVQAKLEKAKAEEAARLEAERLEQLQQNGHIHRGVDLLDVINRTAHKAARRGGVAHIRRRLHTAEAAPHLPAKAALDGFAHLLLGGHLGGQQAVG